MTLVTGATYANHVRLRSKEYSPGQPNESSRSRSRHPYCCQTADPGSSFAFGHAACVNPRERPDFLAG